jgi:hypothetical protein
MSAGGSLPGRPSEDATVVRYGQREIRGCLAVAAGCLTVSAPALVAAALVDSRLVTWVLCIVFALPALTGLVLPLAALAERNHRFVFDATGWWWFGHEQDTLLTWKSLAGVCIHSTGDATSRTSTTTLEFFPRGDFDPAHDHLWKYVRDGDPPADGLPRLRYRIELTRVVNHTRDVEQACRRWVPPSLWHGNLHQPKGYKGRPDRAAHRNRLRERVQSDGKLPMPAEPPTLRDAPAHDTPPIDGPQDAPVADHPG